MHIFKSLRVWESACLSVCTYIWSFCLCVLNFFLLPLMPICPCLAYAILPRCTSPQGLSQRFCSVPNRTSWKSTVTQTWSEWDQLQSVWFVWWFSLWLFISFQFISIWLVLLDMCRAATSLSVLLFIIAINVSLSSLKVFRNCWLKVLWSRTTDR